MKKVLISALVVLSLILAVSCSSNYTVKFDADGGTPEPSAQSVAAGGVVIEPSKEPVKTGNEFIGWFAGDELYTFGTPVTSNFTLTAKYQKVEEVYSVSFETLGGTPVPQTQEIVSGGTATKPVDPTMEGCTFLGWYDGADSKQTIITDFSKKVITSDTVLYAKWSGNTVTVSFFSDDTLATELYAQTVPYGGKAAELPVNPIKSGYTFRCWTYESGKEFSFDYVITSDTKLVASWIANGSDYENYFVIKNGEIYGFTKYGAEMVRATGYLEVPDGVTGLAAGLDWTSIFSTYYDISFKAMPEDYRSYIRTIVLPESVKTIGDYAFADLPNLTIVGVKGQTLPAEGTALIYATNLGKAIFGQNCPTASTTDWGAGTTKITSVKLTKAEKIKANVFTNSYVTTVDAPAIVADETGAISYVDVNAFASKGWFTKAGTPAGSEDGGDAALTNLIVENVGYPVQLAGGSSPFTSVPKSDLTLTLDKEKIVAEDVSGFGNVTECAELGDYEYVVSSKEALIDKLKDDEVVKITAGWGTEVTDRITLDSTDALTVKAKKLDLAACELGGMRYLTVPNKQGFEIVVKTDFQFGSAIDVGNAKVTLGGDLEASSAHHVGGSNILLDLGSKYEFTLSGSVDAAGKSFVVNVYNEQQLANAMKVNGATVILKSAVTVNAEIKVGMGVTLDLYGFTVTSNCKNPFKILASNGTDGSSLTVTDSKKTGGIVGSSDSSKKGVFYLVGNASDDPSKLANLVVEEGVNITNSQYAIWIDRAGSNTGSYNVSVDFAGKLTGNCPIYVSGNISAEGGDVPRIVIQDCAEITVDGDGIYIAGYAKFTVKPDTSKTATFKTTKTSNENVINVAAGDITIEGGEFIAGSGIGSVSGTGGAINVDTSCAIFVRQHNYNPTVKVKIEGGVFKGAFPVKQLTGAAVSPVPSKVGITITGGTFESTNSAEGGLCIYSADDVVSIGVAKGVVSFNDLSGVKYCSSGEYKLSASASGAGVFVKEGTANFTINLNGNTFDCTGPAVGSKGYETQAMHLEKGNTITIKNGTITSKDAATSGVKMLVQNYSDLTLDSVTLDGTNLSAGQYTMSNNNGKVTITNSTIYAANASGKYVGIALDAYANNSGAYTGADVTVNGKSAIYGNVEFGCDSATTGPMTKNLNLVFEPGVTLNNGNIYVNYYAASLRGRVLAYNGASGIPSLVTPYVDGKACAWTDSGTPNYRTIGLELAP